LTDSLVTGQQRFWNVGCHLRSRAADLHAHDNSAGIVSALVLAETSAEPVLLATVGALEGLVMSVEAAVPKLEVFLVLAQVVAAG
jgi:hypothetical protein